MDASCSTCRFAEPAIMEGDGQPVVQCRRYPPAPVVVDDVVMQFYPQVEEGDWCGEHAPVPVPREAPKVVR